MLNLQPHSSSRTSRVIWVTPVCSVHPKEGSLVLSRLGLLLNLTALCYSMFIRIWLFWFFSFCLRSGSFSDTRRLGPSSLTGLVSVLDVRTLVGFRNSWRTWLFKKTISLVGFRLCVWWVHDCSLTFSCVWQIAQSRHNVKIHSWICDVLKYTMYAIWHLLVWCKITLSFVGFQETKIQWPLYYKKQ